MRRSYETYLVRRSPMAQRYDAVRTTAGRRRGHRAQAVRGTVARQFVRRQHLELGARAVDRRDPLFFSRHVNLAVSEDRRGAVVARRQPLRSVNGLAGLDVEREGDAAVADDVQQLAVTDRRGDVGTWANVQAT